jgi:hypothetical protein
MFPETIPATRVKMFIEPEKEMTTRLKGTWRTRKYLKRLSNV